MSITSAARPSRLRPWTLAVGVATAALAAAIGIVLGGFLLNGRGAADVAAAAGYVPADAIAYLEIDLDLPDGQRAALEQLLGRFSGIVVDDVLGDGLAGQLDSWAEETGIDLRYSTDVAPWFDGQVSLTMLSADVLGLGAMAPFGPGASMDPMATAAVPEVLVTLGTRDAAATSAFLDRVRAEAEADGATMSSEEYAGTTIWTLDGAAVDGMEATPSGAFAVVDDQLLVGIGADTLHAALDVHAGDAPSFAAREDVVAALDALPTDRVATVVSDAAPVVALLREQLSAVTPELDAVIDVYASGLSMLQVGSVRFEGNRAVGDSAGSLPARGMTNSERTLAEAVPASALFYLDGVDIGPYLADLVAAGKQAAAASGVDGSIAQVEGILGAGVESFVSWVDEAAITGGWDDDAPWGGLLITPTSVEDAELRLGQLRALANLAGMTGGELPLTVSTEEIDGVEVTRFAIADTAGLGVEVAFEYAIADGRVLIGFGDTFVAHVLATDADSSLAASDRFAGAVEDAGGASSTSVVWADLAAIREIALAQVSEAEREMYDAEAAAWLEPLDLLVGVMRVDGDLVLSHGTLTVE